MGLFSGRVSEFIKNTGDVIDNLHTSKEEKLELKKAIDGQAQDFEVKIEEIVVQREGEITARHQVDMNSDSWLSKNIRPYALAFLLINTMALMWFTIFGNLTKDQIDTIKAWVPLLLTLDTAAVTFYFGGRTKEKNKRLKI